MSTLEQNKNYWQCQLSGMLFRGGGKLHTQHRLSSASCFLNKGWPQALSSPSTGSHAQVSYKWNPVHTYYHVSSYLAGSFWGRHPARSGFVAPVCVQTLPKGCEQTWASTNPVWGFIPHFAADCPELVSNMWHGLIWQCPMYKHTLNLELQCQSKAGARFTANQEMAVITLLRSWSTPCSGASCLQV